jgi:hypothetical protein
LLPGPQAVLTYLSRYTHHGGKPMCVLLALMRGQAIRAPSRLGHPRRRATNRIPIAPPWR